MTRIQKVALASSLFASVLMACSPGAATPTGGFVGAMRTDSSMLLLPDGCTGAFLFDDFRIQRTPVHREPYPVVSRYSILVAPPHMDNRDVIIDVRFAASGPPGAIGAVDVEFAGEKESFAVTLPRSREYTDDELALESANLFHRFIIPARAGAIDFVTRLRLADTLAEDADAALEVDSIEVIYADPPACPELPEEEQGENPSRQRQPPTIPAPPPPAP
jgi:hypothetical protein